MRNITKKAAALLLAVLMLVNVLYMALPSGGMGLEAEASALTNVVNGVEGDFEYFTCDEYEGACVVRYNGDETNVTVPATLGGLPVTHIGSSDYLDGVFRYYSVTNITLPDTVTVIGENAFFQLEELVSVNLPLSLTRIENAAFAYCKSLESVFIPASLTFIDSTDSVGNAWNGCTSLAEIEVAEQNPVVCDIDGVLMSKDGTLLIAYPGGRAGAYTIPSGVTSIGDAAFYGAAGITELTIPASVTSFGTEAFTRVSGISSYHVDPQNEAFSSIDGVLFDKAGTTLLCFPSARESYTIPGFVTAIGNSAFSATTMTELVIPGNVQTIESHAFFDSKLQSVTFNEGVIELGHGAFRRCDYLTDVRLPASMTSIDAMAFFECPALEELTLDENNATYSLDAQGNLVSKDGRTFFMRCPARASDSRFVVPEGIETLDEWSMTSFYALKEVNLPSTLSVIEQSAFCQCSGLSLVVFSNSEVAIDPEAFFYCDNPALTFCVAESSAAEQYALDNGIKVCRPGDLPTAMTFVNESLYLEYGTEMDVAELVEFEHSSATPYIPGLTLTSSDEDILSVLENSIYAVKPGTVTLTAHAAGLSASCEVTVIGSMSYDQLTNVVDGVEGDFEYYTCDEYEGATITAYTGSATTVTIPAQIGGETVTRVEGSDYYTFIGNYNEVTRVMTTTSSGGLSPPL